MGPDDITLGEGALYIDGHLLANICEAEIECKEEPKWPENPILKVADACATISCTLRICTDALAYLAGITEEVFKQCHKSRVLHLAKHGKKRRTRKKNLHRAFRIYEKEGNK